MRSEKGQPEDDRQGAATAGISYPHYQLAKALRRAESSGDPGAAEKSETWRRVIAGMLSGELKVGAKAPISGIPAWVTPEVVRGGFATGGLQAGGTLRQYELALAGELGLPVGPDTRQCLNSHFISEAGLERLQSLLETGHYRTRAPEESALLMVAWLLRRGDAKNASAIVAEIAPFFDRLRFYPRPADTPLHEGEEVHLRDVGTAIAQLRAVRGSAAIAAQAEAIGGWIPLYDRMVALLLETLDGDIPRVTLDDAGKPRRDRAGRYEVSGGLPCSRFPDGWQEHALSLLADHQQQANGDILCGRRTAEGSPYARLLAIITQCTQDAGRVAAIDRGYARLAIARSIAKRGLPDSAQCRERRQQQAQQCAGPTFKQYAELLVARLETYPPDHGLADPVGALAPAGWEEDDRFAVPAGSEIPPRFTRIVGRSRLAKVEDLVTDGLLSSADMLAAVLPQMTAKFVASGMADATLARAYGEAYRAFRRRRSLLLLNLEGQTRFGELPWIAALKGYGRGGAEDKAIARQVLNEVTLLAFRHFPYAILPNTLLRELRALIAQAGLGIPLLDELAADIFMGTFSPKFLAAAQLAAAAMNNTLYAAYYGIDYAAIQGRGAWGLLGGKPMDAQGFADLCWELSDNRPGGNWSVAVNGAVVEQQQIVTTQNLAPLFAALDLAQAFGEGLADLPRDVARWICRCQQRPARDIHSRLIALKNTAYAWRQMIFYLSLLSEAEQAAFLEWLQDELTAQGPDLACRFRPAVVGLENVLFGKDIAANGGRRLLGWAVGRHWLLPEAET